MQLHDPLGLEYRLSVGLSCTGAMNSIIQGQLDRVDTALNALIESIASYNPSVAAANDLLAADDELAKGVKTCEILGFDPLVVAVG